MVAERRMVHDVFLEESMQPAAGSGQEPFTRIAYVSFNPVNRRFEHVSLDSRYPPIMFETSVDDQLDRDDTIVLFVSGFTTPARLRRDTSRAMGEPAAATDRRER